MLYIYHNAVVLDFLDARLPFTTLYLPLKFQKALYPRPIILGKLMYSLLIIHHSPTIQVRHILLSGICECQQVLALSRLYVSCNMQPDNMTYFRHTALLSVFASVDGSLTALSAFCSEPACFLCLYSSRASSPPNTGRTTSA